MTEMISRAPAAGICEAHPGRFAVHQLDGRFYCTECFAHRSEITDLHPHARRQVGVLLHFALDHLWYVSPAAAPEGEEPEPGDFEGCCHRCCAPCSVIKELLDSGDLDVWLRQWPDGLNSCAWWDSAGQHVDRTWLAEAWAGMSEGRCHDEHGLTDGSRP